MFTWIMNLLVKLPIQGSGCVCCEAKKTRLKQMQKEILEVENDECCVQKNCVTNAKYEDCDDQNHMKSYYRYKL